MEDEGRNMSYDYFIVWQNGFNVNSSFFILSSPNHRLLNSWNIKINFIFFSFSFQRKKNKIADKILQQKKKRKRWDYNFYARFQSFYSLHHLHRDEILSLCLIHLAKVKFFQKKFHCLVSQKWKSYIRMEILT